jgi:hypothetical protein
MLIFDEKSIVNDSSPGIYSFLSTVQAKEVTVPFSKAPTVINYKHFFS